jgi:hypothetical protein
MPKVMDDGPADIDPDARADSEQLARQQAIRQVRARRLFKISTASAAAGVTLLVPIWATTEYHNAGGWPARGFSQRSGTHGVWNIWIIYPFLALALITAGHGWLVYGLKPIPESEIKRKIDCQADDHRPSDPSDAVGGCVLTAALSCCTR